MFYGAGLELHDIDIGKRYKGFKRQKPSNPLEPIYPTELEETPEISELFFRWDFLNLMAVLDI